MVDRLRGGHQRPHRGALDRGRPDLTLRILLLPRDTRGLRLSARRHRAPPAHARHEIELIHTLLPWTHGLTLAEFLHGSIHSITFDAGAAPPRPAMNAIDHLLRHHRRRAWNRQAETNAALDCHDCRGKKIAVPSKVTVIGAPLRGCTPRRATRWHSEEPPGRATDANIRSEDRHFAPTTPRSSSQRLPDPGSGSTRPHGPRPGRERIFVSADLGPGIADPPARRRHIL